MKRHPKQDQREICTLGIFQMDINIYTAKQPQKYVNYGFSMEQINTIRKQIWKGFHTFVLLDSDEIITYIYDVGRQTRGQQFSMT